MPAKYSKGKSSGQGKGKGKGKGVGPQLQGIRHSRTERAGLQLPVSRIHRFLKAEAGTRKIAAFAPVFLTAVLEYLLAEVLELSGNACLDNNRKRITPRHLMLAIKNDDELDSLIGSAIFSQSGVLPNIHVTLLPKTHEKAIPVAKFPGSKFRFSAEI